MTTYNLHKYLRLTAIVLSVMMASAVWGQTQEVKIPITSIGAWPNPIDGTSLDNLKDDNTSTTWKAQRGDHFQILEYMQLKNPDNTDDGRRSWIEIPYVPNVNTELEIVFEANTDRIRDWRTQYMFGCGQAAFGAGMTFGLMYTKDEGEDALTHKYLYRVSGQSTKQVVSNFDTERHTLVCTANSMKIDDAAPMTIPSYSYANGNKNLCFFASPYDDQVYASCFEGKIYSVKIRENGKLLYDLVPANGWGRSGFYDCISASFYGFFDMVDYVKNENITNDDALHLHYKIPYAMGSGTVPSYTWSDNLIANGDLASDDATQFSVTPQRIVTTPEGKAIRIVNDGSHSEGKMWDVHFTSVLSEPLEVGKTYKIVFYAKADTEAEVKIDYQNESLGWHHYGDGTITFPTTWTQKTITLTPTESTNGLVKAIGFNFNQDESRNRYYIADISVKEEGSSTNLVPAHSNYTDLSNFRFNDNLNKDWSNPIVDVDGENVVELVNDGTHSAGQAWDCQFRVNLGSESLSPGDKYFISFSYKAESGTPQIGSQLQGNGGSYYGELNGNTTFSTEWQTVSCSGVVNTRVEAPLTVENIGFTFNVDKAANKYYFKDIVVRKGTPTGQTVPDTEVEITFKNTRESMDYNSKRYLFSYGTGEQKVLGMYGKEDKFKYATGGLDATLELPYSRVKETVKFRPFDCDYNGQIYGLTDVSSGVPSYGSVTDFYLFGTHSTDGYDRSFIGEIYGAVIREGNQVKVNLVPACNNGVYGFYEKVTKTFYDKEESCGGSFNFTGAAPVRHGDGITQVEEVTAFSMTIKTQELIAKHFEVTTAADDDTNTNPARWALYGSTDEKNWTPLIGTLRPELSEMQADDTTEYYLYNLDAGLFMTDGGGTWHTGINLNTGNLRKVVVEPNDGKYKLKNCHSTEDIAADGKYMFWGSGGVYRDYSNWGKWNEWKITDVGGNIYVISIDGDGVLGTDDNAADNTLVVTSSAKDTRWAFVKVSDYDAFVAASGNELVMSQDGHKYTYELAENNTPYTTYRFIIDKLVSGDIVNLSEIAFTTNYDFTHYHGRVYDASNIPDNLAVGGSSGYTTDWKTSTDDSRLGSGVKIQRTHEYEHEIYVLPGATVDISPFADFATSPNYMEQYIRWYDYRTDTQTSRLSFDPVGGKTVTALNEGFFAWKAEGDGRRSHEGAIAKYTATSNPTSGADGVIDVIAIEAGSVYNGTPWTNGSYHIGEPTLQWRHTFVIKDAKKRADAMFTNAAANNTYISANKLKLMCPAGTPFQYPLPSYEDKEVNATHPTNYYYMKGGVYTPVYHYSIETVKDGERLGASNVNFKVPVTGHTAEELAVSFKDIDGLNRVFYLKNPEVGKYTIRLHAMNSDCNGGARDDRMGQDTPLLLMEYELEVLPVAKAAMVNAEELESNATYAHQRPANMLASFGKPTTVVDFDDIKPSESTTVGGNHYYSWPWQWEYSSYGYFYENSTNTQRADYNMYMVADHMSVTPFHGRSSGATDGATFSNVYDRKYYDTGGAQRGNFFYANAASDPSRMATVNIGKSFCPNTTIYVSAWINEFQGKDLYAETANVIFSFRGVKSDGTEKVLNSFVTGYVSGGWNTPEGYKPKTKNGDEVVINHIDPTTNPDNRGKWMHVYYTFVPDIPAGANFDHYIITLENNCTSSEGADYAIDDIRAYVCKPQMNARQTKPICNGSTDTAIELFANFDKLKDAFAFNEGTNNNIDFCYCFLDYTKYEDEMQKAYDALPAATKEIYPTSAEWREKVIKSDTDFINAYNTAFNTALLRNTYDNNPNNDEAYGTISINTTYNNNHTQQVGDTRNIVINAVATDANLKVGNKYLIALLRDYDHSVKTPADFKLEDPCSGAGILEVTTNFGEVKIDGALTSDLDGLNFCANEKPVVTINLNGIAQGGEPVKTENAVFDWYFGPLNTTAGYTAYNEEKKNGMDLSVAMLHFRDENPSATQDDVKNGTNINIRNSFTNEMFTYIQEMVRAGKLAIAKTSEVLNTADQFAQQKRAEKYYITAIPINPTPSQNILYCLEPLQVSINLNTREPSMQDGDDMGVIGYPNEMKDVPLRIGLRQLKRTVIDNLRHTWTGSENLLLIPLRNVNPSYVEGDELKISTLQTSSDDLVYLIDSNDPAVLAGTSGAVDIIDYQDPYSEVVSDLKVIGKLKSITASKSEKTRNVCSMAFIEGFKFREGYWYKVKFHFEDNVEQVNACPGATIFTIKVVPEYQMWTGEKSRNWNDDGNWKRVSKDDLLWSNKDAAFINANADFITDGGTNNNTESFVPADFTKVIIPANCVRVPFMYDMLTGNLSGNITFTGAEKVSRHRYRASVRVGTNSGEYPQAIADAVGAPSHLISLNMASEDITGGHVACRPYYDHTCDQIHFNAGAELMDQRYLYYNKAWCDIDVPVGTWQTVASPLMNIVAGDLYLPTATARQETPLFENITYQTSLNDRFKPAVYQRSWNKTMAQVYKPDNSRQDVGIKLDWSHVYNDVNVQYGAGTGFSIKVDVSAMDAATKPTVARFRFPKADMQYTYYNPGNQNGNIKTENVDGNAIVNGVRPGRLGDLSGTFQQQVGGDSQTATSYFLVGNPLMCWLDMEAFFNKNTQFEKKYWIVTAQGQNTALFSEENGWVTTLTGDARYIAPGKSFFLKANTATTTQSPQFTSEMMSYTQGEQRNENNDNNARLRTRGIDGTVPQLGLTVLSANGRQSRAVIYGNRNASADNTAQTADCVPALFDSNLSSDAMIYTSRHGEALSIASIASGDTLPIGIAQGNTGERLSLRIDGADGFNIPLYLIDSELGTVTPLNELAATQESDNHHGETHPAISINDNCPSGIRYYITTSPASSSQMQMEVSMPRITVHTGGFTIHAPANADITASDTYTASGIHIHHSGSISTSLTIPAPSGIYVVKLQMNDTDYEYKIRVR